MAYFCCCDFAVWEAHAWSLKQYIEVILSIELKQSYCEILESVPVYLQYLQSYLVDFMCHLANAVPLLETNLLPSFDVALPSERKKPSWINWMIELSTRWVMLCRFPAHRSRFRMSHHANYWERQSLKLYRPAVHMCSHFGASVCRHMLRETSRAHCRHRSLSILTVLEPIGLSESSRSRLLYLASHRMALTRERKTLSRIAQEIKISQFLLCWSPTFVLKHNSRPQVFSSTICWSWWSINNCEAFD